MGGPDEVEETEYEKQLAGVYKEQWNYYQDKVVPIENKVITDAKNSNDDSVYQKISDNTNLGYQRSFNAAGKTTLDNLTSQGVDPSSGKAKSAISKLSDVEASVSTDAKARSEIAGQERYIDKMSNVMAMGQGQEQEATASLSDIAVGAQQKAANDASISTQNRNNTLGAVGLAAGAYGRSVLQDAETSRNGFTLPADNNSPDYKVA
jgi:hypothetical protein